MTSIALSWEKRLRAEGSPQRSTTAQRFFRTGVGEYGEGDRFIGVTVPRVRELAREAADLDLKTLEALLRSPWHEVRSFALIVITEQAKRLKTEAERMSRARWTLAHRSGINNWDLVDVSIPTLLGGIRPSPAWLQVISTLIPSERLWDRRMAMLATLGWMRQGDLDPCFLFAEKLLFEREDLMQKAVGWMLREAGKRDETRLRRFLDGYAVAMPRTTLRYALERLPSADRAFYMAKKKQRV